MFKGSLSLFEGLNPDGKIAVASITMFVISAVLFFTVGFVSGHYSKKQKNSAAEAVSPVGTNVISVYEDIDEQQQLELSVIENVTFGHIEELTQN